VFPCITQLLLIAARGLYIRREEPCHIAVDLFFQIGIEAATGSASESGVNVMDKSIATDEKGGRPGVEVLRLRYFFVQLARFARDQVAVLDSITLNKCLEPGPSAAPRAQNPVPQSPVPDRDTSDTTLQGREPHRGNSGTSCR